MAGTRVCIVLIAFRDRGDFYRSYLEWAEGPESEGKYLDKDKLGDADAELVAEIH